MKKRLIFIVVALVLVGCGVSVESSGKGKDNVVAIPTLVALATQPAQQSQQVVPVVVSTEVPPVQASNDGNTVIQQNANNVQVSVEGNGFTCINCVFLSENMGYVRMGNNIPLNMVSSSNLRLNGFTRIGVNESWRDGKASASGFPYIERVWIYAVNQYGNVVFWFPIEINGSYRGSWANETPFALFLIPEGTAVEGTSWALRACAVAQGSLRYFSSIGGYDGDEIDSGSDLRSLPGTGIFRYNYYDDPRIDLSLVELPSNSRASRCPIEQFEQTWAQGTVQGLGALTDDSVSPEIGQNIFSSNHPQSTVFELDPTTYPIPPVQKATITVVDQYFSTTYSNGSGLANMCIYGCVPDKSGVNCKMGMPFHDDSVYGGNLNLTMSGRYYQSCAPPVWDSTSLRATFNVPVGLSFFVCGNDKSNPATRYHSEGWRDHWLYSRIVGRVSQDQNQTFYTDIGWTETPADYADEMFCPPLNP